jgi:hypothetical protein
MGELVNLNREKKRRAKDAAAQAAAENRVRHGRTRVERNRDADDEARRRAAVENARIEPEEPSGSSG